MPSMSVGHHSFFIDTLASHNDDWMLKMYKVCIACIANILFPHLDSVVQVQYVPTALHLYAPNYSKCSSAS